MTDKREQALYFPESMLQEIQDQAVRLDRSLSWCVQYAWKRQRDRFAEPLPDEDHGGALAYSGDKRKQTLIFPTEMLAEIQDAAVRLDHSLSWLIHRAWHWTRAEIAQLPDGSSAS